MPTLIRLGFCCVLVTTCLTGGCSASLASEEEMIDTDLDRLYASSEAFAAAAELMPSSSNRHYGDSGENMRATFRTPYENDYQPASGNNDDGYGGGESGGPYGASGGYGDDGGYGGHDHHRGGGGGGGGGGGHRRRRNNRNGHQRANSGHYADPVERTFKYERDNRPQHHQSSGNYPRKEYNNERGFTYEKVYPEKVVSRSYKKDYVQPRRNQQPVEWQGGHDRSYSFSNRGQKNYTPKPVVKNYSSNYGGSMDSRPRGGGGGGTGFGSPSVQTYDYVDPKAGSRTRFVEMVKGKGARSDVAKYLSQPGGIDRYMNDFMNGGSSL